MKRKIHLCILLFLPILLSSCSTDKSNALSEQDLESVIYFCSDYSFFSKETNFSVLEMESDYLSNVAILNEKYPDNLQLKQLELNAQLAFEYVDWVKAQDAFTLESDFEREDIWIALGYIPPTPASAITEGLIKSCEPFKRK